MDDCKRGFTASLLETPFSQPDPYHSLHMPVYYTAAYEFDSAEQMEAAFKGLSGDHAYSRITNPTVQYLEERVKAITGALSVTALNSGMAAITNTFMTIARAGSNIVTSSHLFGNTFSLFKSTLGDFGVEVRFCDLTRPESVREAIDENTCAVFVEIITNPQMEVADLTGLSVVCREKSVPLVADTTIVPFHIFRASDFGVDLEIVSSTKYLSGGATGIGGLILDYGTYDWRHSKKLAPYCSGIEPTAAFTAKLRKEIHRNLGAYMTPQAAYQQTLGLETLEVRFQRAASSTLELTRLLADSGAVEAIHYPGLPDSPYYEVSLRQFGPLPGAMFTFDLKNEQACFRFLNRLKLIRRATNLFDNKSLAIHPWSTIYGPFPEEVRRSLDVYPETIRISVGMEDPKDLFADISQALEG